MAAALTIKPTNAAIRQYYAELARHADHGVAQETALRTVFFDLLKHYAKQRGWHLATEHGLKDKARGRTVDAALKDATGLPRAYCEAKDDADDLDAEIPKKFAVGYPRDNMLFWQPRRAVLYQDGEPVFDGDITRPETLVQVLLAFLRHEPPQARSWEGVVAEFKEQIPALGRRLVEKIEAERQGNRRFVEAFAQFSEVIREAVNPNLADEALEEMLVQHILTERIFRNVFNAPDFLQRNAIAREIENVVHALTSGSFSRTEFMADVERFYTVLEDTARDITSFRDKQEFLNTVYEQFFQGFSVKVADTMGIVYTPQPIVEFMVNSVESLLRREFDLSLASEGVHILDPFVGTGNFIVRVMRHIQGSDLPRKYRDELHCNELMLLPYYIAALNIEHEYYDLTGDYAPFAGICLVDTFGLAEPRQTAMSFLTEENTQRVEAQREADIMVILGNPPYNANQANENDNNKNRKYPTIDQRVRETYAKDSKAQLKNKLSDPYVKAFRWAADRLRDTGRPRGIVAYVSNNSFLDNIAFDGMRRHLAQDFSSLYILDLGGNVRKNPKLSGTTHNVFGIQVGVSISLLVRGEDTARDARGDIYYARVGEDWRREQKTDFLNRAETLDNIQWQKFTPTAEYRWLSDGTDEGFAAFPPMGSAEVKALKPDSEQARQAEALFWTYSNGVKTNRDTWAYNFDAERLAANMRTTIDVYNRHVAAWREEAKTLPKKITEAEKQGRIDEFVEYDDAKISWSGDLKVSVLRGHMAEYDPDRMRYSLYRPYTRSNLYFDRILNNSVYQFPRFFPTPESEAENRVICVPGIGGRAQFYTLATNLIPELHLTSIDAQQCFPFYVYDEDGGNRRENVTDWALARYGAEVGKWDIFHYVYGLLHHPTYRERFAANLRRSLPHIPEVASAESFRAIADAGARLAELHVNYEEQPRHAGLREVWQEGTGEGFRVGARKMKLSKDRRSLQYNKALTLEGIPPAVFDYRLGSRSALEWVLEQYRVKTDKASGIVNDPNRPDDPAYIIHLIGKVITVSLETLAIVNALPPLGLAEGE